MAARCVPVTLGSSRSRSVDVGGFLVTRVRFPPLLKLPLHTHERATVAVILRGSFDGLMRSTSHPCPAATVLTEPAGELHGNLFERTGAEILTVQPDPARVQLLEPLSGVLGEVNHIRDLTIAAVARRAACELLAPDDVAPLAVEGLVLEMLALTARGRAASGIGIERRTPGWLEDARSLLHDRHRQQLRVGEVANAVGVHPVHLARVFRAHYGMSVGAYVRILRLNWAAERLVGSQDTIPQIALQAGFYDQSHFTRTFKCQFGCTPLAYRTAASR
jgi:AraC family transcriptional regulator